MAVTQSIYSNHGQGDGRREGGGDTGEADMVPPTQMTINNLCFLNLVICCHFLIGIGEQMTSVYNFHRQSCVKLTRLGVGLQLEQHRVAQNEMASGLWMSK